MSSGETRYGNSRAESRLSQHVAPVEQKQTRGRVDEAIDAATSWLLERQYPEGNWLGELEGDTILESEYALLLTWMGRERDPLVQQCAEYIRRQQLPTGGWAMFPDGPLEISGSVKAYWTLKIAGDDPEAEHMVRAREAILSHGGAEQVNSFTRFYLALLGIISYRQCPAVPPEIMMLPRWCPLNIYEMSSWSRTIVVPLSLVWAYQPKRELPPEFKIDELFVKSPRELPVVMQKSSQLDDMKVKTWIPWDAVFRTVDVTWKFFERLRIKPFREHARRLATKWVLRRLQKSDGLGAIFPPIIWTVIALRCLGYAEDSPEVIEQLNELEKLTIREGDTVRLEPCRSPVWDTAISINALREAGVPAQHPKITKAVNWLLSKEVRSPGDWSVNHRDVEPGGWYFEFNNEFYPDIDDTIMVTMALSRCLTGSDHSSWTASVMEKSSNSRKAEFNMAIVSGGTGDSAERAVADVERMQPILGAIRRAVNWTGAMQCRDGGWAAFDANNDRVILTRVPFADHNAMIDPPTADITARVLEMYGRLGIRGGNPMFEKAIQFVWDEQETDHCWIGRWGVNYLYGTWQVLVGLTEFGVSPEDARLQAAARWLKEKQQADGGWGETPQTYEEPALRGMGTTTPSQTAWALMGLMAAGEVESTAVRKGIAFLLNRQKEDGTWDEPEFTGTGFPRVFYLRYHLYRHYFPLMALARFANLSRGKK
ncbi:terpene cyclase/mutase family protein [Planctomicrobium sp. SH668]|uniref:terpene cyclase/mutase family protein n=1 Tax=Planctomicrobium sp. SH668 TaxID=3448126 RepID=UPI003F5BE678